MSAVPTAAPITVGASVAYVTATTNASVAADTPKAPAKTISFSAPDARTTRPSAVSHNAVLRMNLTLCAGAVAWVIGGGKTSGLRGGSDRSDLVIVAIPRHEVSDTDVDGGIRCIPHVAH